MPWNGASPFADNTSRMQNWKEVNVWSSLFTLVIFMKVDNIVDVCVLFFNLFTLVIFMKVDNIVDVCVKFCFIL